jgi:hypothetical protein
MTFVWFFVVFDCHFLCIILLRVFLSSFLMTSSWIIVFKVLLLLSLYYVIDGWRSVHSIVRSSRSIARHVTKYIEREEDKFIEANEKKDSEDVEFLKVTRDYKEGKDSYFPKIVKRSAIVALLPPFFAEHNDILEEINKVVGNCSKAILTPEQLTRYVSNTGHCILAETPFQDNFCVFWENPATAPKLVKQLHEWIRRNVETDRFDRAIGLTTVRSTRPIPNEKDPVFWIGSKVPQTHVLVSARTYCMKISLQKKDHHQVAQRFPEDEVRDLPYVTNAGIGEIVTEDGILEPMPLYVTDDDMYIEELLHKEKHDSVIL